MNSLDRMISFALFQFVVACQSYEGVIHRDWGVARFHRSADDAYFCLEVDSHLRMTAVSLEFFVDEDSCASEYKDLIDDYRNLGGNVHDLSFVIQDDERIWVYSHCVRPPFMWSSAEDGESAFNESLRRIDWPKDIDVDSVGWVRLSCQWNDADGDTHKDITEMKLGGFGQLIDTL